jgi:hypothetical protein
MRVRRGYSADRRKAVVIHPARTMGLIHRARSASDRPVRRCSPQDRTCALSLFRASLLIAGVKPVIIFPVCVRTPLARKVCPRNVNDVCSPEPVRLPSLQYTIRRLR